MFGKDLIRADIFFRKLGFKRLGEKSKKYLNKEVLEILQAYADGVNDLRNSLKILPFEFYLLSLDFHKWEVEDTLAIVRLLGFSLTMDAFLEPIRTELEKIYGK